MLISAPSLIFLKVDLPRGNLAFLQCLRGRGGQCSLVNSTVFQLEQDGFPAGLPSLQGPESAIKTGIMHRITASVLLGPSPPLA